MRQRAGGILAALAVALVAGRSTATAEEAVVAGVDAGVVVPAEAFDKYSGVGGIISPFAGYMFNDYLGVMGQLQLLGAPNDNRPGREDDSMTWAFGGGVGPRLVLPLNKTELYATCQGGLFTGFGGGRSSITDTSFGLSAGGGLNSWITDSLSAGAWLRYNLWEQQVHSDGNVKFVSAGLGLTFAFKPEDRVPAPPAAPTTRTEAAPPPPTSVRKIVLRGVNFDFDQATLRPDARAILDEAAEVLEQEGAVDIVVEGHTDSRGSEPYNLRLSERRAGSVADYLEARGIAPSRMEIVGLGESRPVAANDSEDGRAQNRRVELLIKAR